MENSSHPKRDMREPLLRNPKGGGFRALPFILANQSFEKLATYGLTPNMILYLTREYGLKAATAARIINLWTAASYFTPVIGAFLADSSVGRYRIIGFGSIANLLGTVLLWLTTMIPETRPSPCSDQFCSSCQSATTLQLLLVCFSFCLMSIGAGGIRSSSLAFATDQLPEKDNVKHGGILESLFSWYYVLNSVSVLVGITCVVYIQDAMGWKVGFGVPAMLMFFSALCFFSASSFYVKSKPNPSLLTGFAQVIVASFRSRSTKLPSQASDEVYFSEKGTTPSKPSETLRFFNKACVVKNPEKDFTLDGSSSNPWSLCTVEQVEELKALVKVIPIWSTGMIMFLTASQGSLSVLQVSTMDRHITSDFEVPAGSFSAFLILSSTISITLYDRVIVPLASKVKGKPTRLSTIQKMGIGILLASASMAACAVVETVRRATAIKEGFSDNPHAVAHMSAMWLLPHHILGGVAEALGTVGQLEFYYTEFPRSMSSIAANLFGLGLSSANLITSFLLSAIDDLTGREGES